MGAGNDLPECRRDRNGARESPHGVPVTGPAHHAAVHHRARGAPATRCASAPAPPAPGTCSMMIGGQHAREWGSCEICINFAADLLEAYDTGTRPRLRRQELHGGAGAGDRRHAHVVVFPHGQPGRRNHSQTVDTRTGGATATPADPRRPCVGVDLEPQLRLPVRLQEKFHPTLLAGELRALLVSDDPCDATRPITARRPSRKPRPRTCAGCWTRSRARAGSSTCTRTAADALQLGRRRQPEHRPRP